MYYKIILYNIIQSLSCIIMYYNWIIEFGWYLSLLLLFLLLHLKNQGCNSQYCYRNRRCIIRWQRLCNICPLITMSMISFPSTCIWIEIDLIWLLIITSTDNITVAVHGQRTRYWMTVHSTASALFSADFNFYDMILILSTCTSTPTLN